MKPLWSGQLSFGLVNIPVHVHTATGSESVDLDLLHKKDQSRIRMKKICEGCGEFVAEDDIVKGYKHSDGAYVVLSPQDLADVRPEETEAIALSGFVNANDIPIAYFEKPYFLEPGAGGEKSYLLLREAMEKARKVAMVQYMFRHKEHLGVVGPVAEGLVLYQMRFPKDLRDPPFSLPSAKIERREVELALDFVNSLSRPFDPTQFENHARENFDKLVEAKLASSPSAARQRAS